MRKLAELDVLRIMFGALTDTLIALATLYFLLIEFLDWKGRLELIEQKHSLVMACNQQQARTVARDYIVCSIASS